MAIFRDGILFVLGSSQGEIIYNFGVASDLPAPGDYDGDGKADPAVYRDGIWYILGTTSGVTYTQFGISGDKPVPNDFVQ